MPWEDMIVSIVLLFNSNILQSLLCLVLCFLLWFFCSLYTKVHCARLRGDDCCFFVFLFNSNIPLFVFFGISLQQMSSEDGHKLFMSHKEKNGLALGFPVTAHKLRGVDLAVKVCA